MDGFIARRDGSFDAFPAEGGHVADYLASLKGYDAVLMGRKTYDVGLRLGITDPYPHMTSYVFSRTMQQAPHPRVQIVAEEPAAFVRRLKAQPGGDIYLCGGAMLATTLFAAGLIDQVLVKLNPLLLGTGIPLLTDIGRHIDLELIGEKAYDSGVVLLSYHVK